MTLWELVLGAFKARPLSAPAEDSQEKDEHRQEQAKIASELLQLQLRLMRRRDKR